MKYLILQNTIAPYRISLFNKLKELGLDIELLYMCELEKGRSWEIDYSQIKYPYVLNKGPKCSVHDFDIYWNWNFLKRFMYDKDTCIIMGSPWNFPDVVVSCLLKRLGLIKSEIVFWSEANYLTNGSRKKNWFRDRLRSFVYNTGEGRIIIPGQMSVDTFKKWGIHGKTFIHLPNVIEEEKFLPLLKGERTYTPANEQPRFVMPVRLNEKVKGIINFFNSIGSENIKKAQFHILGDGDDEERIKKYIKANNYETNIHMGGFCNMRQMADYYMSSDCLVLPSFSDPSPLSLVEGCCCSMPLLVSNRCGNHFETLEVGTNGFIFNPDKKEEVRIAFETLLLRRTEWKKMGHESRKLFEQNFKQEKVLAEFIKNLKSSK